MNGCQRSGKELREYGENYKNLDLIAKHNTKADVIIAVTHLFLIERGHFKCLGIGNEKTLRDNEMEDAMLLDLPECLYIRYAVFTKRPFIFCWEKWRTIN